MRSSLAAALAATLVVAGLAAAEAPTACTAEAEPNERTTQATLLATPGCGTGSVSTRDASYVVVTYTDGSTDGIEDLWAVDLVKSGVLAIDLSWARATADLDLFLFQESGSSYTIRAGSYGSGPTESISYQAVPGRYYIGVSAASVDSSYTLTVSGTATGPASVSTLTVKPAGGGAGTVTSSPAGISCGTSCWAQFATTQGVSLAAAAAAGSRFAGWGGACSGTGGCTVSMSADREVTATFEAVAQPNEMLLLGGKVGATVTWRSQWTGKSGVGTPVRQLDSYGYFWFESPDVPEAFVKVLDWPGDSYLVFHTALSDVEYTVTFRVVRTGLTYPFRREAGTICGLTETQTVRK